MHGRVVHTAGVEGVQAVEHVAVKLAAALARGVARGAALGAPVGIPYHSQVGAHMAPKCASQDVQETQRMYLLNPLPS